MAEAPEEEEGDQIVASIVFSIVFVIIKYNGTMLFVVGYLF